MKYFLGIILFISLSARAQITINWQLKTSMPSFPRVDFGAFLIDSNYFVVGGADSTEHSTKEVWRYTTTTDHWQRMNNFPGGFISQHQCFAIGYNGYLLTGKDSATGYDCDNQFWQYDSQLDRWTRKSDFPGGKRLGGTSFSSGGKGYFAFGIACHIAYENDIWTYDPDIDSWSLMPDTLPSLGRYGCINGVYDSSAYFVGGYPNLANNSRLNDFWRYNIRNKSWDSLPSLPGVGRDLSLVYAFKDILLAGYGGDNNGNSLGDCHVYNYGSKTWTAVVMNNFYPKTIGNQNACFIYNRTAYCFGGARSDFSFYNGVRSFDATPYLPATNVGISDIAVDNEHIKLYPNPLPSRGTITISAAESGVFNFYDAIGQLLYTLPIHSGSNQISCDLHTTGVVFYTAAMSSGIVENGRVIIMQ